MERYQGKKAVIIGGTSGMGLATAKMLLDGGARVLVTGLSKAGLESAQKEIGKRRHRGFERRAVVDGHRRPRLSGEGRVRHLRPALRQRRVQHSDASRERDRGRLRRDVQPERQGTVFRGPEARAADQPGRRCRPHDLVANVKGMPGQATYGAAKAALRSFARTLAVELLPREIRVNAVTPGPIDTPILGKVFPDKDAAAQVKEKMTGMIPMKRFGTSEEIAKAVLFLAFDATFTTGAEIPVDGGWSQI